MNNIFLQSLPLEQRREVKKMIERGGNIEKKLSTGEVIICSEKTHFLINPDGTSREISVLSS